MESKCSTSLGQCSTGGDFFRSVGKFENLEVQVSWPYDVNFLHIFLPQSGRGGAIVSLVTPDSDGPVFDYDEIICDYTMQYNMRSKICARSQRIECNERYFTCWTTNCVQTSLSNIPYARQYNPFLM